MSEQTIIGAALLGILEGLTEFIPVSSTGHILLAGHFMGFRSTGKAFEVLIQLGAILAILSVYFSRLWDMLVKLPSDRSTQIFVAGILIAFLPAAVVGATAHGFIKSVLFETPVLICIMLILGGFVLLWVDRREVAPKYTDAAHFPLSVYLRIGLFQTLAIVPGVSRSGSTIVGALLWAQTNARQQNFPSSLPCRPWWARLPMIFSRTATFCRPPTCRSLPPVSSAPSSPLCWWYAGCSISSHDAAMRCLAGGG